MNVNVILMVENVIQIKSGIMINIMCMKKVLPSVTKCNLTDCVRGRCELKKWMLKQPVKTKGCSSIQFFLREFFDS